MSDVIRAYQNKCSNDNDQIVNSMYRPPTTHRNTEKVANHSNIFPMHVNLVNGHHAIMHLFALVIKMIGVPTLFIIRFSLIKINPFTK